MVFVMEEPPLSKQALARIKAAKLEAGADLLNGLAAFWRGIGMSSKALREHDPAELMPLFERYAEKVFDAEAKELLACFPEPEAYSFQMTLLPMNVYSLLLNKQRTRRQCRKLIPRFLRTVSELRQAILPHLVQLGETLYSWRDEIAAMWRFTRNNGITEGFHNKMELISRQAYGFRNFENYRLRVKVLCS